MAGEKDDNFALQTETATYFLKVVHPGEPAEVTDLCTRVLLALDGIPGLPVQRVILTKSGDAELVVETANGAARRARMTSYLDGRILHSVPSTRPLRENLGRTLARLGQELKDFDHPAASRPLLWDLWQADQVRPLLDDLDGLAEREALIACLDRFESFVRPRLAPHRRQMIHNDLNADNVLIGEDGVSVVGIIDFGDAIVTQLINDVAVAVVNQLADDDDPIARALDLVRGYHQVVPLTKPELELLYDLVRLRTAMRIIITEWRSRRYPENRDYIMRNTPRAWTHLKKMPASATPEVSRRLIATCQLD